MRMWNAIAADAFMAIHFLFIAFALLGSFLVMRWLRMIWLHIPALAWGIYIELSGKICPLTPLENWLRSQDGEMSYSSDFIAQYLLPVLYPGNLTRGLQSLLGTVVVVLNAAVYWWLWQTQARGASRNR